MTGESHLSIGGLTIALRPTDPNIEWSWQPATHRFMVPPADPDIDLLVTSGDGAAADGIPSFDSGAVWQLFRQQERAIIECRSVVFGSLPYKRALIDEDWRSGTIEMRRDLLPLRLNPFEHPLDELIIATRLARGLGIELHSCGVVDGSGRGRLFVGVSGAGKTTSARLWAGEASEVLSDDRVIVRGDGGTFTIHGTPWHGEAELSVNASAPLAGVYLLTQAKTSELVTIPAAEAMARLFRCAFPPFHDPAAVSFTLEFLERLVTEVPVYEFRFANDQSAVETVLRG